MVVSSFVFYLEEGEGRVLQEECLGCALLPGLDVVDQHLQSAERVQPDWDALGSENQLRQTFQHRDASPQLLGQHGEGM